MIKQQRLRLGLCLVSPDIYHRKCHRKWQACIMGCSMRYHIITPSPRSPPSERSLFSRQKSHLLACKEVKMSKWQESMNFLSWGQSTTVFDIWALRSLWRNVIDLSRSAANDYTAALKHHRVASVLHQKWLQLQLTAVGTLLRHSDGFENSGCPGSEPSRNYMIILPRWHHALNVLEKLGHSEQLVTQAFWLWDKSIKSYH